MIVINNHLHQEVVAVAVAVELLLGVVQVVVGLQVAAHNHSSHPAAQER
jgi:hypothetical protein